MAQFKVPQNVESEDKLLGPLSMKQFIYAIIGLAWGFLWWRIFLAAGTIGYLFMIIAIVPVSGFMLLLAFGRREEQSFENYLIALIRFSVMPRHRLWMKDDTISEAIIDAPPPPKPAAPSAADTAAIQSRLQQLALIVDTRGHAKPADIQVPDTTDTAATFSQRVFTPQNLQQEMIPNQMEQQDDILAVTEEGQRAQAVGELLQNVEQNIRQDAQANMQQAIQNQPAREPVIGNQPAAPAPSQPAPNDAILKTVMDTNGLSVSQVAQAANRGQLAPGQTAQFR